jgi:hypothetical protein
VVVVVEPVACVVVVPPVPPVPPAPLVPPVAGFEPPPAAPVFDVGLACECALVFTLGAAVAPEAAAPLGATAPFTTCAPEPPLVLGDDVAAAGALLGVPVAGADPPAGDEVYDCPATPAATGWETVVLPGCPNS